MKNEQLICIKCGDETPVRTIGHEVICQDCHILMRENMDVILELLETLNATQLSVIREACWKQSWKLEEELKASLKKTKTA